MDGRWTGSPRARPGGPARPGPARPCAPRRGRRRSAACGSPAYDAASGKSWDSPPAPCTWIALSRISWTTFGVAILIAWISVCAPRLPTVSISQAVLSTSSRSCSTATRDSAIQSRTTPCSASGLPKATRPSARSHISSMARSATPIARMQWWIRPGPSRAWAMAKPVALLADQVRRRHPDVLEARARRGRRARGRRTRSTVIGRDRPSSPGVSRGTRIIDCCRCRAAVRVGLAHHDEDLALGVHRAGDPPLAAVERRTRRRRARCGSRCWWRRRRRRRARSSRTPSGSRPSSSGVEPALLLLGRAEHRQHLHVAGVRRGAVQRRAARGGRLRPVISASGAYCRLVSPAPRSPCSPGRKRFHSPRRRASARSSCEHRDRSSRPRGPRAPPAARGTPARPGRRGRP